MTDRSRFFKIIAIAVILKLFLFVFLLSNAPQGRFQNDSADYIESAGVISSQGTFARAGADGVLKFDLHRAPGYAFFLAVLHGAIGLPLNAVIFIQVLLGLLAAWITYKAAFCIDSRIAFLSTVIVLYDPPVSIYSLIILSELLFFFLLTCFMYAFVRYLKEKRIIQLVGSALFLVLATYVRPTSYYLGLVLGVFIVYAGIRLVTIKKAIMHALIFVCIVYGLFGLWENRNYKLTGTKTFASVIQTNPDGFGLQKSFSKLDPSIRQKTQPVVYYAKTFSKYFLSLMTRPGQFKYFRSTVLSAIGKVLAYPWMIFWMAGIIIGVSRIGGNIYYQFILLMIGYFIAASIGGAGFHVGERFRVPMVSFIAVLSAYGWSVIYAKKEKRV